jgi:hypothetical protein
MPTPKTFTLRAHGTQRLGDMLRTRIQIGFAPPTTTVTVTTPAQLTDAIAEWATSLGAPPREEQNAWTISTEPTSGRWPNGYKATFSHATTIDAPNN